MTRIEVLNDTIKYFWGSKERQCVANGTCQYKATETSEGCAIGRLLTPELAASLDQNLGVVNDKIFNKLPLSLQSLGQDFLSMLQDLHDTAELLYENTEMVYARTQPFVDTNQIIFP